MFLSFEDCANAKRLYMETTRNAHGELCNMLAQPVVQGIVTILRALELTSHRSGIHATDTNNESQR